MKVPVPRPMPDYGTKCPSRIATPTKKRTDFLLKIGMGGKAILGFSRLDCDVKPLARRVVQKKAIAEDEEIKTPFAIIKKRSANCI